MTLVAVGALLTRLIHHRLKHAIDHAHMEMHMLVQAGAKAVDKGNRADV